jgi:hypothetical protein
MQMTTNEQEVADSRRDCELPDQSEEAKPSNRSLAFDTNEWKLFALKGRSLLRLKGNPANLAETVKLFDSVITLAMAACAVGCLALGVSDYRIVWHLSLAGIRLRNGYTNGLILSPSSLHDKKHNGHRTLLFLHQWYPNSRRAGPTLLLRIPFCRVHGRTVDKSDQALRNQHMDEQRDTATICSEFRFHVFLHVLCSIVCSSDSGL